MNQIPHEQIESARRKLVKADRLVIFTGAGISAESGGQLKAAHSLAANHLD
jgi:hypothetical protein